MPLLPEGPKKRQLTQEGYGRICNLDSGLFINPLCTMGLEGPVAPRIEAPVEVRQPGWTMPRFQAKQERASKEGCEL